MPFQIVAAVLCCAGCASFTQQAAVDSLHGVLTILPEFVSGGEVPRRPIRIDGRLVPTRPEPTVYRLTPGEHTFYVKSRRPVTRAVSEQENL